MENIESEKEVFFEVEGISVSRSQVIDIANEGNEFIANYALYDGDEVQQSKLFGYVDEEDLELQLQEWAEEVLGDEEAWQEFVCIMEFKVDLDDNVSVNIFVH